MVIVYWSNETQNVGKQRKGEEIKTRRSRVDNEKIKLDRGAGRIEQKEN